MMQPGGERDSWMEDRRSSQTPNRLYITSLLPHQETVAWKIQNVSELLKSQAWTAIKIPMQVGLGIAELSSWHVSLMARNNNSVLCARTLLISPEDQFRRVTHHLSVAVVDGQNGSPIYHFPSDPPTTTDDDGTNAHADMNPNSNNPTNNTTNSNTNANLTNNRNNNRGASSRGTNNNNGNNAGCGKLRKALRRLFVKNANLDGDLDDLMIGDGRLTKEARPAHKAPLSLWKIVPIDKIEPGEEDCIELRVTLTVFGCDVQETRI